MSEFELAYDTVLAKANTKFKPWIFVLSVPEEVAATIPYTELREVQGELLKNCPFDPVVGDYIDPLGHRWQVIGRIGEVVKPRSHQQKKVPIAVCSYVQRLDTFRSAAPN